MKSRLKKSYSTCMMCGGKKMKNGGKWIQGAIKNPGAFTAQAKREGMSTSAFRDKVLANKEDYSPTTVRRANLAKTLSKMRKGSMGMSVPGVQGTIVGSTPMMSSKKKMGMGAKYSYKSGGSKKGMSYPSRTAGKAKNLKSLAKKYK